jgi:hypothetical protein
VPGARKDFLDRFPEAERAIADGEVRRDLDRQWFSATYGKFLSPHQPVVGKRW